MTILQTLTLILFTYLIYKNVMVIKTVVKQKQLLKQLMDEVVYFLILSSRMKNIIILTLIYILIIK